MKFSADVTMTDAAQYPVKDNNDEPCGLIKLSLVIPEAEFEGNIISTKYKNGEWLIYMTRGSDWITIKTPHYQPLRLENLTPIESNVTYVMIVEIPLNDSTDYYLEQARRAKKQNNMERFIQCIEKVPKNKVPKELTDAYEKALLDNLLKQARQAYVQNDMEKFIKCIEKVPQEKVPKDLLDAYKKNLLSKELAKEQNELINTIRRRTNNYTTIPDEETYKLCRQFMNQNPDPKAHPEIYNLMRTEGKRFISGQSSVGKRPQTTSSTTASRSYDKNTTSNKPVTQMSKQGQGGHKQLSQKSLNDIKTQKGKHDEPFISVGIGIEPFLFIPEDEDFDIEDCGIAANAVLRIGRPKNLINGMLGIGASTGSEIEPNLHAVSELRFNFGGNDDDNYFVGLGADIALSSFSSTSDNNETDESSCFKVMAGYRKKKFETFLGVRMWDSSALCIGLRWYLF